MRESHGGVSLETILDGTFPDLVDLWEVAVRIE
jgi:hypothetical protein